RVLLHDARQPLPSFPTRRSSDLTKDAYDRIVGEMLGMVRDQGPWDAVLLANHGAAVSEEHHDVDGEIAARVREIVGPGVPIGMADRKSTRLNSSHEWISYAVFCW